MKFARYVLFFVFSLSLVIATPASGTVNVKIDQTRIIFDGKKNQTYWSLTNTGNQTYFFIASIHQTNSALDLGSKARSFIVSPPSGLIKPNEVTTFKIVKTNDNFEQDVETLSLLQVKLLSAVDKETRIQPHHFQNLVKIFIKLFYRPKNLIDRSAISKSTKQLFAKCDEGKLTIDNKSNYWLTLDAVMMDKLNIINYQEKKPVLAPLNNWTRFVGNCPKYLDLKLIEETGLPTPFFTVEVESIR